MTTRTEIAEEVGRWFKFVVVGSAVWYGAKYVYEKWVNPRITEEKST